MAVSIDYVTRETASNLWRNRLMTIAAVLTVAVSLSLVGAALLLRQGVAHATTKWQHGVNVLVFLSPVNPPLPALDSTVKASSPTQQQGLQQDLAIQQELTALPYVRTCTYKSQDFDFNEAHHLLPPDESQALSVDSMPASLRCVLQDPRQAQAVYDQFNGRPGVQAVSYPSQAVKNMEQVTHILQWVFLTVAVILLLSASVLILNTIRLAIFARRREVAVMKVVGATNWFIRVPFMCEGLVQGVLGALVAALVVVGLHWLLDDLASGNPNSVLYQMRMPASEVIFTNVLVVLVGLVVGTIGSAFAIRRFLET
ncbi:MAG TPA: permease-like cell division protein FtsX [Acidimicrobiales bacterium]|nr:permease-like cell division protein FtsX [Acidimicrobiales bacterium]